MSGRPVGMRFGFDLLVGTYDHIMQLPRSFFSSPKNVGIVPVFQNKVLFKCNTFQECIDLYRFCTSVMRSYKSHLPETKADLNRCRRKHICQTFRPGENLHNYYFKQWYNESYTEPLTRLLCFRTDTQEPFSKGVSFTSSYIIVRKTPSMPRFDPRFANYAFNKVQWIEHLRYRGYVFWVITDAFGFDIPHPP